MAGHRKQSLWESCPHMDLLNERNDSKLLKIEAQKALAQHVNGSKDGSWENQVFCVVCHNTGTKEELDCDHIVYVELDSMTLMCSKCHEIHECAWDQALCHISLTSVRQNQKDINSVKFRVGSGIRGLVNLGSTCFMNSILQVLVHIPQFRSYFLAGVHRSQCRVIGAAASLRNLESSSDKPAKKQKFNGNLTVESYLSSWSRPWWNTMHDTKLDDSRMKLITNLPQQKGNPRLARVGDSIATLPVCFGCEFESFMGDMYCSATSATDVPVVAPQLLHSLWVSSPFLAGYLQQDAHEFFNTIVNSIHSDTYSSTSLMHTGHATHLHSAAYPGPVQTGNLGSTENNLAPSQARNKCECIAHKVFGGIQSSRLVCDECGTGSQRLEEYFDISLNLLTELETEPLHDRIQFLRVLRKYFKSEALCGSEQLMCTQCGVRSNASKTLCLVELPQVLCFQLKRFKATGFSYVKDDSIVELPFENLNMRLVQHSGTLESGHYVAHIKQENTWFCCDDDKVWCETVEDVKECQPYLVFYGKMSE